ncbi:MAG TPA: hypothetical protein DEV87_05040 [Clostridiales bacterium]|nr:hypothetical protein [Clostridiales bacterium]
MAKKVKTEKESVFAKAWRAVTDFFYGLDVKIREKIRGDRPVKQKPMKSAKIRQLAFYIGFMILPLLQLAIFYFVVNFNSFALAFQRFDVNTGNFTWSGFDNFKQLFFNLSLEGDPLRIATRNSLVLYACGLLVGTTLALFFSFYIYKKRFISGVFRVVLFLPTILSNIVTVIMFKYFTDQAIPALWSSLFGVEVVGVLSNPATMWPAIVFYNIWISFGANVLIYVSSMTGIPEDVSEYAELDGVSMIREFFQITLPLIYPTITSFLVIGVTNIFLAQGSLYEFFGDRLPDESLYTLGYYLFRYVLKSEGMNNYSYASAVGILSTLVAVPLTIALRKVLERFDPSAEE